MRTKAKWFLIFTVMAALYACSHKPKEHNALFKGVYSFGPEEKSFRDCENGQEFWVVDSSAQLELKYSQLQFEKPYEQVYVEVEGKKMRSGKDGLGAQYDSTLVVKKLRKITKVIPDGLCN